MVKTFKVVVNLGVIAETNTADFIRLAVRKAMKSPT